MSNVQVYQQLYVGLHQISAVKFPPGLNATTFSHLNPVILDQAGILILFAKFLSTVLEV